MAPAAGGLHPATIAARAAGAVDHASGGIVRPIQPSTTFLRDEAYALVAEDHNYARDHAPTVRDAEAVVAALEGAAEARLFASGMAAIAAVMRTVPPGGAIALQRGIYYGTTQLAARLAATAGIRVAPFEGADLDTLRAAVAEEPGLVFTETPSNPWLTIVDIAAAAEIAHAAGAALVVDSTAATPILSRPLVLGADLVVHSATKFLNGHSDVLAGVVATSAPDAPLWAAILAERHDAGAVLGPFEAWLLTRGLRTLDLRVRAQSASALHIASHLSAHPAVETVRYPGLASHPDHAIARRQMAGGFGGLMSFDVAGGAGAARAVAGRLRLVKRATSLGGVETLIEHRHTIEPASTGIPPGLLRLSVGIEHVGDLLADLDQALAAAR